MPRDYSMLTGPTVLPVPDPSERQRFSFWRPHATPIQASLLEVTGWLGADPDRSLAVSGRPDPVPAAKVGSSESVLFRLERPGTRERADWEWYFLTVRRIQAHGRLVCQKIAETKERRERVDQRLVELRAEIDQNAEAAAKEHAEFVQKVHRLEAAARGAETSAAHPERRSVRSASIPSGVLGLRGGGVTVVEFEDDSDNVRGAETRSNAPYRQLVAARDEGRALAAKWAQVREDLDRRKENLERERAPIEQRLRWLEERASRRVFPGLFATINAFLDIQALSAASVAIEEFRRTPRRESALADELEARLAAD
jgi:hypothetical protein